MEFADLARLASAHVEARIIQTAVELQLFDSFKTEAKTSAAIASRLGTDPRATELMLNALVSLGLVHKENNRYSLADIAAKHLVTDAPHYLGAMIRFDASLWHAWEQLPGTVRSGQAPRPTNMYQDDPQETECFIAAMDSLVKARGDAAILAQTIDWQPVTELLDIGSGPATYPIYLCRRFPELRATIFDLPGTMKITERLVKQSGLAHRFTLIPGDYLTDPIPGRYQVIFLSNIIHGEGYQENENLIAKLALNLSPGGRIIIKDHILDETRANPPVGAIFSMLMLLTTRAGRCYSFAEIKSWMTDAGLTQVHQVDLPPPLTSSLVIGER